MPKQITKTMLLTQILLNIDDMLKVVSYTVGLYWRVLSERKYCDNCEASLKQLLKLKEFGLGEFNGLSSSPPSSAPPSSPQDFVLKGV